MRNIFWKRVLLSTIVQQMHGGQPAAAKTYSRPFARLALACLVNYGLALGKYDRLSPSPLM